MSSFDEKLDKHIEKVLEIQNNERDKMLSLEEMKELDMSLGITEEEWEQMMKKAEKDTELAQNHFYYKNYRDAYSTAESAISINPYITQALILLADSALMIYETEHEDDFLLKAEKHAKEVLKQAPAENRAIEILAILNKHKKSEKLQRTKILKIGSGVIVILIIILTIVFWPREEKPKEINQTIKFELIDAEENVNSKWAQVENVMSRRDQLIPQLMSFGKSGNEEIDGLKTEIENLKQQINSAEADKKVELQAVLQIKYQELTALIAKDNNNETVATLMIQIEGSYNRIAVEAKGTTKPSKIITYW